MNAGIELLKDQIKAKKAALSRLHGQEAELKRLQAAVANIPKLQADIAALERSVGILKGEEIPDPHPQRELESIMNSFKPSMKDHSIPSQVRVVLRNAGKPMTADQIMGALASLGNTKTKLSVLGAIYRNAKNNRIFRLESPGVFGLLEWPKVQ